MPSTHRRAAAYVRLHARRRPSRTAVVRDGASVTYAALNRDLAAVGQAVAGFGLAPGAVVALNHHDLYIHLLLLLALEARGVVTGSFRLDEGAECHPLLTEADLVLAPVPIAAPVCRRMIALDQAWVNAVLAGSAEPAGLSLAAATDPLVILRSSGTTGARKRMVVTYAMMAARLRRQREPGLGLGLNRDARFLAIMHFSVVSIYMAVLNCLRLGATVIFDRTQHPAAVLADQQPTHLTLLPFQLRALLDVLPDGGPILPDLTVQTIGAKLPAELRRLALRRLGGRLTENYGANETGAIGAVDEAGTLRLAHGMTLHVTGPHGAELPDEEIGAVRIRGEGAVACYVGDPAATAEAFRHGWFHPGDLALRLPDGNLRLVGRRVDVLNLGGIKVASAELESKISQKLSLRDVAVLQRNDAAGSPPLTVCLVADRAPDINVLTDRLRPLIPFPFTVRIMPAIPRTNEGKIKRLALQKTLFGND